MSFSITTKTVFAKISGSDDVNNNRGSYQTTINFVSDDIEFLPFITDKDYWEEPVKTELPAGEIINFAKGESASLVVRRSTSKILKARVSDLITRLKLELASGLTTIKYSELKTDLVDISETSNDGTTWV